jgi:ABC-2 type transport system ATP-binding protein
VTADALAFTGVEKSYGRRKVLKGIDLAMPPGEYLALVGVNGAGKSTMLKCLLDFTAIEAGQIEIFGRDHAGTESRCSLSYLPEKFIPPYYLTGRDFLAYMARLHGVPREEGRIREVLSSRLDFDPVELEKPVRQLSKGMSQKLGLAACLLSDKPMLVLDEPMSGLDPRTRACLKQYLLELKGQGKSVFFSTHMLADVAALCDRVAILHEGVVRFAGTPAECRRAYGTEDLEAAYLHCVGAVTDTITPDPSLLNQPLQ